jgi:hypothetical protein
MMLVASLSMNCSGDGETSTTRFGNPNGPTPADSSGQVTELWRNYCTATFTTDYAVVDVFDELEFTAKAGEVYLLTSYAPTLTEAELVFLVNGAPYPFAVASEAGQWPFTTNCESGQLSHYAVFQDVTVFSDESMTVEVCTLAAGTVLPLDPTLAAGFSTTDFSFGATSKYSLSLNAFASQCGGNQTGYIEVPSTEVFNTTTYLIPVISIIGPGAP